MKTLILCTGNSCRSQMAEAFLKSFNKNFDVFSAGTNPAEKVHPFAIQVMEEIGVPIDSNAHPKKVEEFLHQKFDYVITVCDGGKENCPIFTGSVKNRIHIGFEDPANANGTEHEILNEFRRVRDEIKNEFNKFYITVYHE